MSTQYEQTGTMVYVFHQNMNRFHQNEFNTRGKNFAKAFTNIREEMKEYYLVAGLTEVSGDPARLAERVVALTKKLDRTLTKVVVIDTRNNQHVAIAYDSDHFTLEHAGSAWTMKTTSNIYCHNVVAASIKDKAKGQHVVVGLPPDDVDYSVEYSALAYVAGLLDGTDPFIFGFMHNDWSRGNTIKNFQQLPKMKDAILVGTKYNDLPNPYVVFGGDFNVTPRNLGGLVARYQKTESGKPVATTTDKTHDFWLTNVQLPPEKEEDKDLSSEKKSSKSSKKMENESSPEAAADDMKGSGTDPVAGFEDAFAHDTRGANLSYHSAITLRIKFD